MMASIMIGTEKQDRKSPEHIAKLEHIAKSLETMGCTEIEILKTLGIVMFVGDADKIDDYRKVKGVTTVAVSRTVAVAK